MSVRGSWLEDGQWLVVAAASPMDREILGVGDAVREVGEPEVIRVHVEPSASLRLGDPTGGHHAAGDDDTTFACELVKKLIGGHFKPFSRKILDQLFGKGMK